MRYYEGIRVMLKDCPKLTFLDGLDHTLYQGLPYGDPLTPQQLKDEVLKEACPAEVEVDQGLKAFFESDLLKIAPAGAFKSKTACKTYARDILAEQFVRSQLQFGTFLERHFIGFGDLVWRLYPFFCS